MSWSKGNKKWTIPFGSLNGTSCRIDIYERNYTGEATELSSDNPAAPGLAAADPIYYEEDNNDNLLSVIRSKTGYINLVETVYGGLSGLYPHKNNELYVEFYYGQALNFIGFIQAQSFDNAWKAAPREISLPIISPLGLLESITMPIYNPPQALSLAAQLSDVMDMMDEYCGVAYSNVIWPSLSTRLDITISSLVTSPFNPEKSPSEDIFLFKPITAYDYIEGLCNCFGWVVHETATQVVFSMFDHMSDYLSSTVENLRTLSDVRIIGYNGHDRLDINSYFTPSDNDGKESIIMPVDKVVLDYDGEYVKSAAFNFAHLVYNGQSTFGSQSAAWLTMVSQGVNRTPELLEGNVPLLSSNTFSADGRLAAEGVNPCSCGTTNEQTECFLVNLPRQNVTVGLLFTIRYYDRPTGDKLRIKWKMRWGDTLTTLTNEETIAHKMVGVKIRVGSLWYHGQGEWNTTEPSPYNYGSGEYYWDISNVPYGMPIEVSFYEVSQSSGEDRVQILTIESLRLEESPVSYSDYIYNQSDNDIINNGNGDGEGEANVEQLITAYRKNSNMIGTDVLLERFTNYEYMLQARECLVVRFKKLSDMQAWMYLIYMTFAGKKYRIISVSEYPWDDEVTLTLQSSSIFDT